MKELRNYYRTRLASWAVAVALLGFVMPSTAMSYLIVAFGQDSIFVGILKWLTLHPQPAIVLILAFGEFFIRKYLWKLEHRELDFSGEWEGETCYTTVQVAGTTQISVPFPAQHKVKIVQDCLSFRLDPAPGEKFINWKSLAVELDCESSLMYAYKVNYSDSSRFPDSAVGYEEMDVTERDDKNLPLVLTGKFWHCAQGKTPVI